MIKLIEDMFPDALANASFTTTKADATNPAILLRTVDRDPQRLALRARSITSRYHANDSWRSGVNWSFDPRRGGDHISIT